MKAELTFLAGKIESTYHEEIKREQTQILNFLPGFLLYFYLLVRLLRLHSFESDVRPVFGAHPKTGAATLAYLHIDQASVDPRLYLIASGC